MGDHFCHNSSIVDASFGPTNPQVPIGADPIEYLEGFRGGGGGRGGGGLWYP